GSTVLELAAAGHRLTAGKPAIPGLPPTYGEANAEAETPEINLADAPSRPGVTLVYTIFRALPIVARSVRFRNGGNGTLRLDAAMSASLDLPDAGWDLVHLSGMRRRE